MGTTCTAATGIECTTPNSECSTLLACKCKAGYSLDITNGLCTCEYLNLYIYIITRIISILSLYFGIAVVCIYEWPSFLYCLSLMSKMSINSHLKQEHSFITCMNTYNTNTRLAAKLYVYFLIFSCPKQGEHPGIYHHIAALSHVCDFVAGALPDVDT